MDAAKVKQYQGAAGFNTVGTIAVKFTTQTFQSKRSTEQPYREPPIKTQTNNRKNAESGQTGELKTTTTRKSEHNNDEVTNNSFKI